MSIFFKLNYFKKIIPNSCHEFWQSWQSNHMYKKINMILKKKEITKISIYKKNIDKLLYEDWLSISKKIFLTYVIDNHNYIEKENAIDFLVSEKKIDFANLKNEWIGCLLKMMVKNQNSNNFDGKAIYKRILFSPFLNKYQRANLELELLKISIEENTYFFENEKTRKFFSSILSTVKEVIDNGFIFENKLTNFRSLLLILSHSEITDNLDAKKIKICLENFSILTPLAKKVIFKNLINKKQETIVLNLLNHGIDLNWKIDFEGNGKKEVCSLKILEDLKLSEHLFTLCHWDISVTNSSGNNILHMMCGSSLTDNVSLGYINQKLSFLDENQKKKIFNQENFQGLSPMNQAILFQDETMIDFLIEHGVKRWGESVKSSPYEFLIHCVEGNNNKLLSYYFNDFDMNMNFWDSLLYKWESEKLNEDLNKNLKEKDREVKKTKL